MPTVAGEAHHRHRRRSWAGGTAVVIVGVAAVIALEGVFALEAVPAERRAERVVAGEGQAPPTTTAVPTTLTRLPSRSPVNQPMRVAVSVAASDVAVGEEVVFSVEAEDDWPIEAGSCHNTQSFGDDSPYSLCTSGCTERSGGQPSPRPPERGAVREVFRHTYRHPGTYEARFSYNLGSTCERSRYRSTGEATITITVTPT